MISCQLRLADTLCTAIKLLTGPVTLHQSERRKKRQDTQSYSSPRFHFILVFSQDRSSRDPSSGGSVSQLAEQAASVTNSYEPSAELSETREGKDEVDGAIETVHQLKEAWVLSDEDDIRKYTRVY